MAFVDLIGSIHRSTTRDYLSRVLEHDKAEAAAVAKRFDREYFDGDRRFGYGGYRYDGRWRPFARALVDHYGLAPDARVLDVGCAKGFLVHDLVEELPSGRVEGIDVSAYALAHAVPDVRDRLRQGTATALPYEDDSFDLVVSVNTVHNLTLPDLERALREIERVSRGAAYLAVDSYRSEREKANLLYWQLTCECFFRPEEWQWLFDAVGYTGDADFVYFD